MLTLCVACGGNNSSNNQTPHNDAGMTNDASTTADAGMTDMGSNPAQGCDKVENLGAIEAKTIQRKFHAARDEELASCRMDVDMAEFDGTYVAEVEYPDPTRLTITSDGIPLFNDQFKIPPIPVAELRSDACLPDNGGQVVSCAGDRIQTFTLEANKPYFIAFNGRLDSNGVKIQFDPHKVLCSPNESSCADGTLTACDATGMATQLSCADDCSSMTACRGNTCDDPIEVALTAGGSPVEITGDRGPYTSEWSAENLDGCSMEQGVPAGPSDGVEFFLHLTGLSTGQTLDVDAEASQGNYGFYIVPDCTLDHCITAFAFDANSNNRGSWTVDRDGDVYMVVEAYGMNEENYDIKLTLN